MTLKQFISTMDVYEQIYTIIKIREENNIEVYNGIAVDIFKKEEYQWLQEKMILVWKIVDDRTIEMCI